MLGHRAVRQLRRIIADARCRPARLPPCYERQRRRRGYLLGARERRAELLGQHTFDEPPAWVGDRRVRERVRHVRRNTDGWHALCRVRPARLGLDRRIQRVDGRSVRERASRRRGVGGLARRADQLRVVLHRRGALLRSPVRTLRRRSRFRFLTDRRRSRSTADGLDLEQRLDRMRCVEQRERSLLGRQSERHRSYLGRGGTDVRAGWTDQRHLNRRRCLRFANRRCSALLGQRLHRAGCSTRGRRVRTGSERQPGGRHCRFGRRQPCLRHADHVGGPVLGRGEPPSGVITHDERALRRGITGCFSCDGHHSGRWKRTGRSGAPTESPVVGRNRHRWRCQRRRQPEPASATVEPRCDGGRDGRRWERCRRGREPTQQPVRRAG